MRLIFLIDRTDYTYRRSDLLMDTKGISSGLTYPVDANGLSWSVCVEVRIKNGSWSGLSNGCAQRHDASYPTVIFFNLASVFPPRRWLFPAARRCFPRRDMFPSGPPL
jgi:hypothetical protein